MYVSRVGRSGSKQRLGPKGDLVVGDWSSEYGRVASGSRNRGHLTDPDGGGEGHSQGTGEVAVLEACVRRYPPR